MTFSELHQQEEPLLIGNVWDAKSAATLEKLGFKALATSSAAISYMLGYEDGEHLSFEELKYMAGRIASATTLPLSVDIEGGYSRNTAEVLQNIEALYHLGVVGINLEDSVVTDSRKLIPYQEFAEKLAAIRKHLDEKGMDLFVNARTDTYILDVPDKLKETIIRVQAYEAAGADGIFTPFMGTSSDIEQVVQATQLPLNVLSMPNLPSFAELKRLGVKRISTGNFLFDRMHECLENQLSQILKDQSFESVFHDHE